MASTVAVTDVLQPETHSMKTSPAPSKADSLMKTTSVTATGESDAVRTLRLDEYKAAALSLAEAFKDDHVSKYFLDTPEREIWSEQQKWDLHVKIMEYIVYAHLLKGLVVSAGPNYDCVALW